MDDQPGFSLAVSQNKYIFTEDVETHAVLTVRSGELTGAVGDGARESAEVIAIDCSGSMDNPPTKIAAARRATAAAVDALRDGAYFAVVEGTHLARMVYPARHQLVPATPESRSLARQAVQRLSADGGTAMGSWLRLANRLLDSHPEAVRHVMLLTDGKNEHETRQQLDEVLAACTGKFGCDARGIGENWVPDELLHIVSALHGTADAIREHGELVADFTAMMRTAMGKVVPDLRLQITTSPFARLRFVKQTYPTENDLTGRGVPVDERTTQFSTGSWGDDEDREYHVCLSVDRTDGDMNVDLQAAEVDLVTVHAGDGAVRGHDRPQALCVHRTNDLTRWSERNPKVEHATGQTGLRQAIRTGCAAYESRNLEQARVAWGDAVRRAAELGNETVLTRLHRLVEVDDPTRGQVRLKPDLSPVDVLSVAMGSVMSSRSPDLPRQEAVPDPRPVGRDRTCPDCRRVSPANADFCEQCGHEFSEPA
jgi:Ca-activated chloride channel family protein